MELREAVKKILREMDKTQVWLSEQMGYSSNRALQNALARGNMELNNLLRLCEKIGGRLIIDYGNKEVELTRKEKR